MDPELADLSPEFRHQPWLSKQENISGYPDPIVDVQSQIGVGKKSKN